MSLQDSFCSSPWFHIRIDPAGYYKPCRWYAVSPSSKQHISTTTPTEYLQSTEMDSVRSNMLNGVGNNQCCECLYQDTHNKVSGRQRQLLKSAIHLDTFTKTLCSSPQYKNFAYSNTNNGATQTVPVDLQIDLGNTCNSSCIICLPKYSSRVLADHIKLNKIEPDLFKQPEAQPSWSADPALVDKFVSDLDSIPNIKYIHFMGGETLYMESFYVLCNKLIENGSAKDLIIGITTNCTVYNSKLEHIINSFKEVHLGLSIEAVTDINDYIRWPSKVDSVLAYTNKFLALRCNNKLQVSLRTTPNIFSIWDIDKLFVFMLENNVIAESCNILSNPSCLRIELLPESLRAQIIQKINNVISTYKLARKTIEVNQRRSDLVRNVTIGVIFEYLDFLTNYLAPENAEEERLDLVRYIKSYESIRNNKITNYLPEYEDFLRNYKY